MIGLHLDTGVQKMGTGSDGGGYINTYGAKNKLPDNKSQLNHIFAVRPGHLANTKKNRQTLTDLINNKSALKGKDKDGCKWYVKTAENGAQYWAKVYNGVLSDGGYNRTPKQWNEDTGLCKNPFKKGGNR